MFLYNSLTRRKEKFAHPRKEPVKLYVCGITPYDTTHLGHAFTYIFFDTLARYLTYKGYKVKYVQNVTDIDDDILREANKRGENWKSLGERFTRQYLSDMKKLNALPPTHFVKAIESIPKMRQIIKILLKRGFAYQKKGNIYFGVKKFAGYGRLSRLNRRQMILLAKERGANVDDTLKKDPLDFVLWQKSKPGEPSWSFDNERGRPGWHIECSAMIHRYLGETIDIHGGGKDLIFPHHESEIAQSESYTGKKPFSRFFLHTAMILCNGEKMSKSLGNLIMVKNLLGKYSPNAVRWCLLSHYYRQPFEYEEEELKAAAKSVGQVEGALTSKLSKKAKQAFANAMDDDCNTSDALSVLQRNPNTQLFQTLGFVVK